MLAFAMLTSAMLASMDELSSGALLCAWVVDLSGVMMVVNRLMVQITQRKTI